MATSPISPNTSKVPHQTVSVPKLPGVKNSVKFPADSPADADRIIGRILKNATSDDPKLQKIYHDPITNKDINLSGGKDITLAEEVPIIMAISAYLSSPKPEIKQRTNEIFDAYSSARIETEDKQSQKPYKHDSEGNLITREGPQDVTVSFDAIKHNSLLSSLIFKSKLEDEVQEMKSNIIK